MIYNEVDESIKILRDLQSMLFEENFDKKILFEKTLEIEKSLNIASMNYNLYLNEKTK